MTAEKPDTNGWNRHEIYVMNKLEEHSVFCVEILKTMADMQKEIADIKTNQEVGKTTMHFITVGLAMIVSLITSFVSGIFHKGG